MRRPKEKRKLHEGNRYSSPGAMVFIVGAVVIGLLVGNYLGFDRYMIITIGFFLLILAGPVLLTKYRSTVWVGKNPRVYHAKRGCNGANNDMPRSRAQDMGLEPCSKCHKVHGMNRR